MHIPDLSLQPISKHKERAILHSNLLDLLSQQRQEAVVYLGCWSMWWHSRQPGLLGWFLFQLCSTTDSAWSLSDSWIYPCLTCSSCTESLLMSCTPSTVAHVAGSLAQQHHTSAEFSSPAELVDTSALYCIYPDFLIYFTNTYLPARWY